MESPPLNGFVHYRFLKLPVQLGLANAEAKNQSAHCVTEEKAASCQQVEFKPINTGDASTKLQRCMPDSNLKLGFTTS
jgi:hypothetical protein